MALSVAEGTKQKTMDIINRVMGFPPNTIKYARIFSRWVTRDNYPMGSFTAGLDCYIDENPGPDQATSLHHEFGCTIPQSAITAMGETDDREVLYKHLEYIINFQDAQQRQESDPKFDPVAEEAELQALATELGIETLFHVAPVESESESVSESGSETDG